MAAFVKFNQTVEDLAHRVHDLGGDTLKVALSNSAPSAGDSVFADIAEISGGNGYTAGGSIAAQLGSGQVAGVYKLALEDVVFTASGGAIGPFRYVVLYNASRAGGPLLGWYDNGESMTLNPGETFTVDFDASLGVLTLA